MDAFDPVTLPEEASEMLLFIGVLSHANELLRIYNIPEWHHVVYAAVDSQVGTVVGGRKVYALSELPVSEIRRAIVLGGDWTYGPLLEALCRHGLPREKIVLGTEPDRIHAELLPIACPTGGLVTLGFQTVYHDVFHRPWYAWPMIVAADIARRMRIPSICAVEFGVFAGDGLLNMASLAAFINATIGVQISVLGFDTGAGLPRVADWRDHPELWKTSEFVMPDVKALRRSLPSHSELIIGDIAQTLHPTVERRLSSVCPLGFVALDVDTYSSSVSCLKIFDLDANLLLPVVPVYVDDSNVNICQTRYAGEALAIEEFNAAHQLRKIDHKVIRTDRPQMPWHHTMHFAHVFDHPVRTKESDCGLNHLNHFYY